jgi:hypothetical protein
VPIFDNLVLGANVAFSGRDDHYDMNNPHTLSKLWLVEDQRSPSTRATVEPVRRYRLARLQLDSRAPESEAQFEHLKRVFD